MNGLDFAIIFAFLAIIFFGFFGGITRVLAAMLAIYIATVVAAMFYSDVTDMFRDNVDNVTLATGQLFIFFTLFLVTSLAIGYGMMRGLSGVKSTRRLRFADNLTGVALGLTVSALAVVLATVVMSILLQVLNQTAGSGGSGALAAIEGQISSSALTPVFLDVTPIVTRFVQPWFPNGLPAILS